MAASRPLTIALLVSAAWSVVPASAQSNAASSSATDSARDPIVIVVDPGTVRIAPDRLRRSIAAELGRELVRLTDERAAMAIGTLTVAHDGSSRWLVRYESRGRVAAVRVRITRPGIIDDALGDAAAEAITEVERAEQTAPPAADMAPLPQQGLPQQGLPQQGLPQQAPYLAWIDELLDPFVGAPPPPRRELAIFAEVIDPFAPAAARRVAYTEVLDPWGR